MDWKKHVRNVPEIKYGFAKSVVILFTFYKILLTTSVFLTRRWQGKLFRKTISSYFLISTVSFFGKFSMLCFLVTCFEIRPYALPPTNCLCNVPIIDLVSSTCLLQSIAKIVLEGVAKELKEVKVLVVPKH